MTAPERFFLTFEARDNGDGPPPAVRVRRLLKAALRQFGLRCVDLRDFPPDPVARENRGPRPVKAPRPTETPPKPLESAKTEREAAPLPRPGGGGR